MGMRHGNLVTALIKAVSKKGTVVFHGKDFTLNAHFDLNLNDCALMANKVRASQYGCPSYGPREEEFKMDDGFHRITDVSIEARIYSRTVAQKHRCTERLAFTRRKNAQDGPWNWKMRNELKNEKRAENVTPSKKRIWRTEKKVEKNAHVSNFPGLWLEMLHLFCVVRAEFAEGCIFGFGGVRENRSFIFRLNNTYARVGFGWGLH